VHLPGAHSQSGWQLRTSQQESSRTRRTTPDQRDSLRGVRGRDLCPRPCHPLPVTHKDKGVDSLSRRLVLVRAGARVAVALPRRAFALRGASVKLQCTSGSPTPHRPILLEERPWEGRGKEVVQGGLTCSRPSWWACGSGSWCRCTRPGTCTHARPGTWVVGIGSARMGRKVVGNGWCGVGQRMAAVRGGRRWAIGGEERRRVAFSVSARELSGGTGEGQGREVSPSLELALTCRSRSRRWCRTSRRPPRRKRVAGL
jgi:hypothetical protein